MHFDWGVILRSLTVTGLPATDTTGRFRIGTGTGRTVTMLGTSGIAAQPSVRAHG